jgi:uncharacterized RDD family membrane protein YckC
MRCPKCHYVSFDGQSRCRNCGYDFSLAQPADQPIDLPTRTEPASAQLLADLSLKVDEPASDTPTALDRYISSPSGADAANSAAANASTGAARAPARGPRDRNAPNRPGAPGRAGADADTDPLDLPLFSPAQSAASTPASRMPESEAGGRAARPASPASADAPAGPSPVSRAPAPEAPGASGSTSSVSSSSPHSPQSPRAAMDDRPLVSGAAPPRAPLSVRRRTGEVPPGRGRATPSQTPTRIEEPRLDLDIPEPSMLPDLDTGDEAADDLRSTRGDAAATAMAITRSRAARVDVANASDARAGAGAAAYADPAADRGATASAFDAAADVAADTDLAPLNTRLSAGLIDIAFMAAVDALVLYFTIRVTGVSSHELRRLPIAPLLGFLALLNGGYLAMFTAAAGQTMGKMAMGVKVVNARGGPVPFGSAVIRALAVLLTIGPAGVGFIPALLTPDRRALHDRFADTKVIKTSD